MINVTVTAYTGPGKLVTANVFTGAKSLKFDVSREVLTVEKSDGVLADFDLNSVTTTTFSISGKTYTVTVS